MIAPGVVNQGLEAPLLFFPYLCFYMVCEKSKRAVEQDFKDVDCLPACLIAFFSLVNRFQVLGWVLSKGDGGMKLGPFPCLGVGAAVMPVLLTYLH